MQEIVSMKLGKEAFADTIGGAFYFEIGVDFTMTIKETCQEILVEKRIRFPPRIWSRDTSHESAIIVKRYLIDKFLKW